VRLKQEGSRRAEEAGPCRPPNGVSGAPGTIEQLIDLLNALPRPTTVACFLESLDRPLNVYHTRSSFSAQPADGESNPRTFITIGRLSVSVVPGGRASHLLEFGYRSSEDRSIKGEVVFQLRRPVTQELLATRIEAGFGSTCGGHTRESVPTVNHFPGTFESNVITPSPFYEVELALLRAEADACDSSVEAERCSNLSGLLDHGPVRRSDLWPTQ
jgi:hypothetical protein